MNRLILEQRGFKGTKVQEGGENRSRQQLSDRYYDWLELAAGTCAMYCTFSHNDERTTTPSFFWFGAGTTDI